MEEVRKDGESEAEFSKRILEDALIGALAKVHVNIPEKVKAALEKFRGSVTLAFDGDTRKPMMGDNDLTAAIAEWAKTEEAKHYITASINSGGGATGGARGWQPDRQTRADWDLWEFMPHCKYWEAVALSLNLEPPIYESSVKGWPPEYERRRKIAAAHMECKNLQRSKADHGYGTVDLSAFSAWAQSLEWSLPDRFPRTMAKEADTPAAQDQIPTGTVAGVVAGESVAGNSATCLIEGVIERMTNEGKKVTPSSIWVGLGELVGKSIIEDSQPGKFLCNIGDDDYHPITKESVRGILARWRARLKHA